MKRLALFLVVVSLALGAGAQELKIGTFRGTAVFAPLFVQALKQGGMNVQIKVFENQPELIQALASRSIDGAFFLAQPIIAKIRGAIMVPVRLHQTDFYAISTDPAINANNPGELRKYSVGIVEGNMAHAAITREMQTTAAASDQEQFSRLVAGDYQIAIAIDKVAFAMAKAMNIKNLHISERPLLRTPTFLALAAGQEANKGKITAALKAWQDNGKWDAEMSRLESR